MQKCKLEAQELRERDKEQDRRIEELTDAVRRMVYELKHDRDMSERDRELLVLRLENALLRFERRLPPGEKGPLDEE